MVDWLADVIGSRECAQELFDRLTPAPRSADSYLCRQGDPTDSLIFIERGPISVILERAGPVALRVRVFGAHTLVGEVGFFLEAPRSASLLAAPEAIAWALSRNAFDQFMHSTSQAGACARDLRHPPAVRAPDLRQPPDRLARTLTQRYCFQAANASAKARSPGVPFSIARMARRLLL